MHKPSFVLPLALVAMGLILAPKVSEAQSDTKEQKSTFLFDVQVDKLLSGAKSLGMDDSILEQANGEDIFEGINAKDVKRIFGSTSIPKTSGDLMAANAGGPIPVDFFFRISFNDAEAMDRLMANIEADSVKKVVDGKEYFSPPQDMGMLGHKINSTTFEMGTAGYLTSKSRNFQTDRLKQAFSNAPKHAIRIILDLESNEAMIAEGLEMAKGSVPPPFQPVLGVVDNISTITICLDLEDADLLTIHAEGKNEDDAEELRGTLDGLLGMAKFGLQQQVGPMLASSPEMKPVAQTVFNAMTAKRDASTVKVVIPRPEGFKDAVAAAAMMMSQTSQGLNKQNNSRQVMLGMMNYYDARKQFPFQAPKGESNDLSWRARILPYIEQNKMYDAMDMTQGPDATANSQFAMQMPEVFGMDGQNSEVVWIKSDVKSFSDITDGTSNTAALLEVPGGRPWLNNNPISQAEAVALVKGLPDGQTLVVTLYDGSTFKLGNDAPEDVAPDWSE